MSSLHVHTIMEFFFFFFNEKKTQKRWTSISQNRKWRRRQGGDIQERVVYRSLPAALSQPLAKSLIYGARLPRLMSKFTAGIGVRLRQDTVSRVMAGALKQGVCVQDGQKQQLTFALVGVFIQDGFG